MAFTKTPTGDTYSTKMIPFVYKWDARDDVGQRPQTPDSISSNVVFEPVSSPVTGEKIYHAYKRDGINHLTWALATPPNPTNNDFGNPVIALWYNPSTEYNVVITYDGLVNSWYVLSGPPLSSPADIALLHTSNLVNSWANRISWTDYVYASGEKAVFISSYLTSNIEKLQLSGGFANTSINPGIGVHNGDPVTLDGYVFLSTPDGNIYNSNLDDPATWNASNFISAESFGDGLRRIARSGTYIVAFGNDSIEWFYDAANPTGSPLAVYTGATKRVGYLGGVSSVGDALYFVGRSSGGAVSLYKIEGLKLEIVADFTIARRLTQQPAQFFIEGTGNFLVMNGHTVYVWRSEADDAVPICYDLDAQLFLSLTFKQGDLDILQSTSIPFESKPISSAFCREADNRVYYFQADVFQDDGVDYTVFLQTKKEDFDTRRNKFGARALLHTDQTNTTSLCQLSWSVDDYKTYNTPRNIDLQDSYPSTWALGIFRSIAFRLSYTGNFPMRFKGLELDYNQGGA